MDGEVLVASPFQGRHVLGVLRVPLQRLGDAIPFDEILDWDRSSMEARYKVTFDGDEVEDALEAFETTVRDIEQSRETRDWFEITEEDRPSEGTCSECDIRWECPARPEYSLD